MKQIIENGKYISLLSRLILKETTQSISKLNLSTIEYSYIMILFDKEISSQEELTKAAMVDKAQTTRAIQRLLERGLIHKQKDSTDKRVYNISLTQKGLQLVPKIREEIVSFETKLNQGLTYQEQKQMKKYLIQMIRNMRE